MDQIGRFQLGKILGQGASATVYLAHDPFSGQDVALKVLNQEVIKHPEFGRKFTAQFMNEASLAGKLSHPHIASILEASLKFAISTPCRPRRDLASMPTAVP